MRPVAPDTKNARPAGPRSSGRRAATFIAASLLIVLTLLNAALTWWFWPTSREFLRDDDSIDVLAAEHPPREILWQKPRPLPAALNVSLEDYEPRLSWDGLTLFFVRGKAGENADLYFATRTPEGWSEPQPLDAINTPADELGPAPTLDGRELYFYSDREGGVGGYDLWVSQRGPDTWLPPINLGPRINSQFNDYGAALAPDGVTLYFASNRPQPTDTRQPNPVAWHATIREERYIRTYDLFRAERTAQGWTDAAPIAALNSPANEGAPCVTPIGDFLYWASDRDGGLGGYDLYRARIRDNIPLRVENLGPLINSSANELDPGLTQLGFALYFSSDRRPVSLATSRPTSAPTTNIADAGASPSDARAHRNYDLFVSESREVYRERVTEKRDIDWAALWTRLWPWLLALLAALLLTWRLWKLLGEVGRRRLSLLARCMVASLLLHTLLMLLFTVWQVGSLVADAFRPGGPIQVALAAPNAADAIAAQLFAPSADAVALDARSIDLVRHEVSPPPLQPLERVDFQPTPATPAEALRSLARAETGDAPAPTTLDVSRPDTTPAPVPPRTVNVALPQTDSPQPSDDPTAPPINPSAAPALAQHEAKSAMAESPTRVELALPQTTVGIARAARSTLPTPSDAPTPRSVSIAHADNTPPALLPPTHPAPDVSLPQAAASATPANPLPTLSPTPVPTPTSRPAFAEASPGPAAPSDPPRLALMPTTPSAAPDAGQSLAAPHMTPPVDAPSARTLSTGDVDQAPRVTIGVRSPDIPLALPTESSNTRQRPTAPAETPSMPQPRAVALTPTPAALTPQVAATDNRPNPPTPLPPAMTTRAVAPNSLVNPLPIADARPPTTPPAGTDPSPAGIAQALAPQLPAAKITLAVPTETELPPEYVQRQPENRAQIVNRMGGTPETEKAVNAALAWLARVQSPDGRWDGSEFTARCAGCDGVTDYEIDTALTGLSLLCFLGAGHTHAADGPYRDHVQKGLAWLTAQQNPNGDLRRGEETMYSHGMASIALSEAYGMTKDAALRPTVQKAIDFIISARNPRTGAWRYEPGQDGDTSVLGWQVMALKSARLAGIEVPDDALAGAQQWLARVARTTPGRAGERGLFAYRPDRRATRSMTAEGMFVLQMTGIAADDPRLATASRFVLGELPNWKTNPNTYYWYYATLALFQQHHDGWERWNTALHAALLPNQRTDTAAAGSWDAVGEWTNVGGRIYQTALCTLMLEVYYRYLPLYTREFAAATPGAVGGATQPPGGAGAASPTFPAANSETEREVQASATPGRAP